MTHRSGQLKIVKPYGYPSDFNTPRFSKHAITSRYWLPLHKLWKPLEAALIMPAHGADLIASFNRIPLGRTPFVISFESHLPRLFGFERTRAFRMLSRRLTSPTCRKIIPISHYADRTFAIQHKTFPWGDELQAKTSQPIYPSVLLQPFQHSSKSDAPLKAVFIGSHFSRKGGLACLVAAKRARESGVPLELHIVSNLTIGGRNGVWTDPNDTSFLEPYLQLLQAPNVVHHGSLSNAATLDLLRSADVCLLPTLSDTFGYSVLEAFSCGVPVIGTRTCALPEFIIPDETGILLDLETDDAGEWKYLFSINKDTAAFRRIYIDTLEDLATQIYAALSRLAGSPSLVSRMKLAAHSAASTKFNAQTQSQVLDSLYESVLA